MNAVRWRSVVPLERDEQALYFQWLEHVTIDGERLREHVYAIPNGGSRDAREAARLTAQGVTAGVGDINVDVPSGAYHGLRIELKRIGEIKRLTTLQAKHIELRRRMGYHAVCCEGFEEARRVTIEYLSKSWEPVDRWAAS